MAIAIPMLLLVLFGYALKLDVDNVPLIVWDQSNTPASREFLAYFTGSRYFELRQYATGYHDIEKAIDKGDALVGLVIPRDFAESAQSLAPVRVQAIVDGSDSNTATIALGYLDAISMAYSKDVLIEQTRRIVGKVPEGSIDFRPRVWFNADLESKNYIIPGLIAVIMMVIAALLTSLTVSKEWEQGTMEQLISTPVKGPELIVGKLLPYFAVGMLDVLLAVLMGVFLFDVPLRGSVPLLFAVSAAFLVGALALGMLITLMLTSMAVVREKEVGTMEQIMVTPITPGEFILGKTAPFAVIGFADVLLITIVAVFWFQVPIRGSLPLLFIATGLYIMTTLGIGLIISTMSSTQQQAMMSTFFFYFPAVLLSGFMFPIANMPVAVQWLTYANPLRYFLVIIRGIFLKGVGPSVLWPQMAVLLCMGVVTLWFAMSRFKKTSA